MCMSHDLGDPTSDSSAGKSDRRQPSSSDGPLLHPWTPHPLSPFRLYGVHCRPSVVEPPPAGSFANPGHMCRPEGEHFQSRCILYSPSGPACIQRLFSRILIYPICISQSNILLSPSVIYVATIPLHVSYLDHSLILHTYQHRHGLSPIRPQLHRQCH